MLELLDFPDETLLQILSHFVDKSDFNPSYLEAALVCKRLNAVATPLIYEYVSLNLAATLQNSHYRDVLNPQFQRFAQTIRENDNLAPMVQEFDLHWEDAEYQSQLQVTTLLEKLTSLRRIGIWTTRAPFRVSLFGKNRLKFLKHADLSTEGRVLEADDLASMMVLESIRTIEIEGTDIGGPLCVGPRKIEQTSSMTHLNLGHCVVPQSTFRSLLLLAPKLRKLRCGMPGHENSLARTQMTNIFSPVGITSLLWPLRHSLVTLSMHDKNLQWPGHDLSRLDLNEFIVLKDIFLSSNLLFGATKPHPSRSGAYKLLPRSLEKLAVSHTLSNHRPYSKDFLEICS